MLSKSTSIESILGDAPTFRTFSLFKAIVNWSVRICLFVIIYDCVFNFNENPIVISVVIICCSLYLLSIRQQTLTVYHNRFELSSTAFLKLFKSNSIYFYSDIISIRSEGIHTPALEIFAMFFHGKITKAPANRIFLNLANGRTIFIRVYIFKSDLEKAIDQVKVQLNFKNKKPDSENQPFYMKL